MVKKGVLFCTTIILVGAIDWITTTIGIVFFGATETNPLFTNLTQSNMLIFSIVKLSAVTLAGFAFYLAETRPKISNQFSPFAKKLLNSGYAISILHLPQWSQTT